MERVAFNNYVCGTLTVLFVALVVVMAYFTLRMSLKAFRNAMPSAAETPPTIREGGLAGATAYCSKTGSVVPRSHWGDGRRVLCVRAGRGNTAAPGLAQGHWCARLQSLLDPPRGASSREGADV
jgi:hypothetical protein